MKIASFKAANVASYGIVSDAGVIDAGKRLKDFPTLKALLAKGSLDELKKLQGERADHALKDIELLPTVPDPDKILCIGVNYATHLAESGARIRQDFPPDCVPIRSGEIVRPIEHYVSSIEESVEP